MTRQERHTHQASGYSPTPWSEPAIRALLDALGAGSSEPTMSDLHRAVCERVREMRDEGAPPETVLAAIKRTAAGATADGAPTGPQRTTEAAALVSHVAQWCIAEYFRKP